MTIETVLNDFGMLTKRQKQSQLVQYAQKLDEAYALGDSCVAFSAGGLGLQDAGACLLGDFLIRHPDVVEIRLPGNLFYNPRFPTEVTGFTHFIQGLMATRDAGKLRVLDLSKSEYLPSQLAQLGEVLREHPSIKRLMLNSIKLSDAHLEALTPYLESETLEALELRYNALTGAHFEAFTHQLNTCPALNFLDLTANSICPSHTAPLKALLTHNKQLFIRCPGDNEVLTLSLQNRNNHFIPSRMSLMMHSFDALTARLAQLEIKAEQLEVPQDLNAREQILALEMRLTQMSQTVDENKGRLLHQMLQQEIKLRTVNETLNLHTTHIATIDNQLALQQSQLVEFRTNVTATQAHIQTIEERLTLTENEDRALNDELMTLKQILAQHEESIEILEESLPILEALQKKLEALESQVTTLNPALDLTDAQKAYVQHFKKMLVRMHMSAMVISTGLVKVTASGKLAKAGQILNAVSSAVPFGAGIGVKMIAYCLQSTDSALVNRRMQRLSALGDTPEEVSALSEALSIRLIQCLDVENPVKEHHMAKLLSGAGEIVETLTIDGFYGALMQVFENTVDDVIDSHVEAATLSEMEIRSERDAQLLLAAVAESTVLDVKDATTTYRLFLYAVPLMSVADRIFHLIVDAFCQKEHFNVKDLSFNAKKRGAFYGHLTKSWHKEAQFFGEIVETREARERFITDVSSAFSSKRHDTGSIGVFYFKENPTTIFSSKRHTSWYKGALTEKAADDIMGQIKQNLRLR